MNKKKILFISNIAAKKVGSFSIASICASKNVGFEYHLAANFRASSVAQMKEDEENYNIKLHQIDFERNPLSINNYKAYKQMLSLIKNENFDIVHCNTPIGGLIGRVVAKKVGVNKVIYQAHGFHFYKGAPLFNRTIIKWAEMIMAHWTDEIITINHEDYEAALNFKLKNNGKVYYVPGVGINTQEYFDIQVDKRKIREQLGLMEDDVICISMGDLIDRKNYKTAIQAIALANDKKIHYLICGQGPELENLTQLVKDLQLEQQVHFLGFRTDIKELLKISDIFLFTTKQEGLPRSMMEAMASGLPCIASKIRGNVDLLENNVGGYLISYNDVIECADKIKYLSKNKDVRNSFSLANIKRIQKFDHKEVEKCIEKIYENINLQECE